ncbi:hypothetical protein [Actinomycetospora termitidis]|uniref:TetR family transcriptional regulator n=1 Tax=Actinomycetospora termitidis TaxID=3053470 RepID=A0ABT7MII8_9PSEU|nr:hypothetical protein [Actinomycetospora sp. Odt1-22]MDL5160471.1 hypothetical protein [Actinomycetospora sp. Odt1-22]
MSEMPALPLDLTSVAGAPSLGARLRRRGAVARMVRSDVAFPETEDQIVERLIQLDPELGEPGTVQRLVARLLTKDLASGESPRLLASMSMVLGVERAYLTDPDVADRSDCALIVQALIAGGVQGQVRICRSTGAPGVAEIMMEILYAMLELRGEVPQGGI